MFPFVLTVLSRDYGVGGTMIPIKDSSYKEDHPKV